MVAVAIGDERVLAGFALAGVRVLERGTPVPPDAALVIATDGDAPAQLPPDALVVVVPS